MFESSLVAASSRRPRSGVLGTAVGLHGALLAAVLVGNVWRVEAVRAPTVWLDDRIPVLFEPPPAQGSPRPAAVEPPPPAAAREPTPPPEVVRPVTPPDPPPSPPPEVPSAAGPPPTGEVATAGPVGVPEGVPFGDPDAAGAAPGGGADGSGEAPLDIDARIVPPRVLQRVQPVYTERARLARVEGAVILEAVIDRGGRVTAVRVLSGLPHGLDRSAVTAVQQWRFRPATLAGRPVPVFFRLTVRFEVR